jgi:hypothetical protein
MYNMYELLVECDDLSPASNVFFSNSKGTFKVFDLCDIFLARKFDLRCAL